MNDFEDTSPDKPAEPTRPSGFVTAADLGDDWPLTVDEAELRCLEGDRPVVIVEGRGTFGLTGHATQIQGVEELPNDLWRDNPAIEGAKVSITALRDLALKLC